jgi:diphthamide biosynthesis protein 3
MSMYEEVPLAKMTFNEEEQLYTYSCPCGDVFEISLEELHDGEDVAPCPSCSLKIRVLFEESELPPLGSDAVTGGDDADDDQPADAAKTTSTSPAPAAVVGAPLISVSA